MTRKLFTNDPIPADDDVEEEDALLEEEGDQVSYTETDEFKLAVAAKAKEVVADLLPGAVAAALASAGGAPAAGGDIKALASEIAAAIKRITKERNPYPIELEPDEHARREKAMAEMFDLLNAHQKMGILPQYRVRDKVYLAHQFIEPFRFLGGGRVEATKISWAGPPNLALYPIDEHAKKVFALFLVGIGHSGPLPASEPKWVTPEGLIINGGQSGANGSVTAQERWALPTDQMLGEGLDPLESSLPAGEIDPRAGLVRVLGTVAEPARQGTYGSPIVNDVLGAGVGGQPPQLRM